MPITYYWALQTGKRKYVEDVHIKSKQTSITSVRNHLLTVVLTPLIFGYPLPLMSLKIRVRAVTIVRTYLRGWSVQLWYLSLVTWELLNSDVRFLSRSACLICRAKLCPYLQELEGMKKMIVVVSILDELSWFKVRWRLWLTRIKNFIWFVNMHRFLLRIKH